MHQALFKKRHFHLIKCVGKVIFEFPGSSRGSENACINSHVGANFSCELRTSLNSFLNIWNIDVCHFTCFRVVIHIYKHGYMDCIYYVIWMHCIGSLASRLLSTRNANSILSALFLSIHQISCRLTIDIPQLVPTINIHQSVPIIALCGYP